MLRLMDVLPKGGGGDAIPSGVIALWSGLLANIPAGWSLCDGGGGRRDLRSQFVRGAANDAGVGGVGGADTHTLLLAEITSHNHTGTLDAVAAHGYHFTGAVWTGNDEEGDCADNDNRTQPNHQHTVTLNAQGGGGAHQNMPAYYQVAYIQRD